MFYQTPCVKTEAFEAFVSRAAEMARMFDVKPG